MHMYAAFGTDERVATPCVAIASSSTAVSTTTSTAAATVTTTTSTCVNMSLKSSSLLPLEASPTLRTFQFSMFHAPLLLLLSFLFTL